MKRLSLIIVFWCLTWVVDNHTEVYSQANAMPELTSNPALAEISRELYELMRNSGADQMGADALLRPDIWEKWTKESGFRKLTKGLLGSKAVTHFEAIKTQAITSKLLTALRDGALVQIDNLADIFLSYAKSKKGSSALLEKAKIAEAKLQALVGSGLTSPCAVPNSASVCKDPNFQEQWSLLKVLGFAFKHFLRTLEPLLSAGGGVSFQQLKSGLVTKNTSMFMNMPVEFSDADFKQYPIFAHHGEAINKNIFLTVPLIAANEQTGLIRYLETVVKFVGDKDQQLKRDIGSMLVYWRETLKYLTLTFQALHSMQRKNVPGEVIKPTKLNLKLLPWDKAMVNKVISNFTWLPNLKTKTSEILKRCQAGLRACRDEACKQRYDIVMQTVIYYEELLRRIEQSLKDLNNMTSLQMVQ